ncbi:hypothetical protein GO986_16220 [Deinococcus sp. HMF7620]|uniref:Uncharacterized protein n=1 Tax=Deinococcus arboris TaxID=2682977 RepID=A0A7C9HT44_9DEIO|nr:hypothetical protein [Deinococcus arboris]MVN88292.1 hypothetical protein [Deinococcus arboris]
MLTLPIALVEALAEEAVTLRYIEHLPLHQVLATWLNAQGGKDPKAKKLPRGRAYSAHDLMSDLYLPAELRPFRFTPGEAQAILGALPHLSPGGSWVLQALVNRVLPLDQIQAQAEREA